jgi:ElaB/YqjD/DUF883 family membrane-anchored ribosome-binding protein
LEVDPMTNHRSQRTASASDRLREQSVAVAQDLREVGQLTGEAAKEKLSAALGAATEAYRKSSKKVRASVASQLRERPILWLAVAAGTGAMVGCLLARRRSPSLDES